MSYEKIYIDLESETFLDEENLRDEWEHMKNKHDMETFDDYWYDEITGRNGSIAVYEIDKDDISNRLDLDKFYDLLTEIHNKARTLLAIANQLGENLQEAQLPNHINDGEARSAEYDDSEESVREIARYIVENHKWISIIGVLTHIKEYHQIA